MHQLDEKTLNYLISKEIEVIKQRYEQLRQLDNLETKQILYSLLLEVNHQLPVFENEQDYLGSYRDFDR